MKKLIILLGLILLILHTPTNILIQKTLSEYRPKEKNTDINNQNNNKDDENSTLIISNVKETIYKVQEGDTLFDISKKFYGNGNDYKKIIESNKEKYPSLLKVSEVKTGWELILV